MSATNAKVQIAALNEVENQVEYIFEYNDTFHRGVVKYALEKGINRKMAENLEGRTVQIQEEAVKYAYGEEKDVAIFSYYVDFYD